MESTKIEIECDDIEINEDDINLLSNLFAKALW